MSKMSAERLLLFFGPNVPEEAVAAALEDCASQCATTIANEMSLRAYFELSADEAKAWAAKDVFGEEVSGAFPSTDFELREETRCYALGLYTAAVFHLMRALEVGLSVLAVKIGAPFTDKTWQTIINNVRGELKRLANDPNKPADWKELEQFYSEVLVSFENLKNAWRNYTMHLRFTYDKEKTEEIFIIVRGTMRTLATRIAETP